MARESVDGDTVLLADDGAGLASWLEHWGWPAERVADGAAAFEVLRRRAYGCVVCAHRAGAGDGLALARRWTRIRDPATALLVSAAEIDAETAERYAACGVRVLARDGAGLAALRMRIAEALALHRQDGQDAPVRKPRQAAVALSKRGAGRARYWVDAERRRYYRADLVADLFDAWSLVRVWGGLDSRRGTVRRDRVPSYADGLRQLESIDKRRRQRGYVPVSEAVGRPAAEAE